jgi:hypothetical protein
MEKLSTKLGNDGVCARRSTIAPTRFERLLGKVGMATDFWGKQAGMQAALLLGSVTLYSIAGVAESAGRHSLAGMFAWAPMVLGSAAILASDRMVNRQTEVDEAQNRPKTVLGTKFVRTLGSGLLALGIVAAAGRASPELGKMAHGALFGPRTTESVVDRMHQ